MDSINSLLWTGSLYLTLDADKDFRIRIVKWNKTLYNSAKELAPLSETQSTTFSWGVGYIQNSLTLSWNLTGNEYIFDK
jgi:hypothetical protein